MSYVFKTFSNKETVIWLKKYNRYVILQPPAIAVFEKLQHKTPEKKISQFLEKEYEVSNNEAEQFITDIKQKFSCLEEIPNHKLESSDTKNIDQLISSSNFRPYSYQIQNRSFQFHYSSRWMKDMVHQGIKHFQKQTASENSDEFWLIEGKEHLSLIVNQNKLIQWPVTKSEYFKGSVSLQLLNSLYQKTDDDWMGTFHAAALEKNNKAIIISASSGKGKSTLAALLAANGLKLISDDLVPISATKKELYCLPQAISVKPGALKTLQAFFPELNSTEITHNSSTGKDVYYLTKNYSFAESFPKVSAIIFPNYNPEVSFQCNKIDSILAFQKFIPEAWVAPNENNVKNFLDWFGELPCWQLTYSDNKAMVKTVKEIFDDEL